MNKDKYKTKQRQFATPIILPAIPRVSISNHSQGTLIMQRVPLSMDCQKKGWSGEKYFNLNAQTENPKIMGDIWKIMNMADMEHDRWM